ncbi:uncharacterized protein F4807DRAFT_128696 [Annulohypoxylon truncatum]|uniref:uncharacterized protein n=1 Tax=Annulohypoxylon truncatum TaxID=327061 RepID=UPI0020082864|nr:uncharacterized protein F4807DRAFT_128696 [Annulohypoxylon truncatum]KAI1214443.1 hypothetical protein F4807DRAFT_128696 [Annulohypoxylon truncatum]
MATWCRPKQTGCVKMVCSFQCCKSRRDESGRISSKYCKKHTCAHFHMDEELPRCERPKDPSDSVCIYHARCPIDNCKKARIQIQIDILADEPRFKREKYCSDHTCLYEGCVEIRSTMRQGEVQYRPYCNEHVCHADGCAERNTKPLGGWYCKIHGCKKAGCSKEADNSRRYCEQHNRCEWSPSRCLNPKLSGKELCATHSQCETDGCQAWKEPDSPHCLKHSCGERGCKISSGNYKYCNER